MNVLPDDSKKVTSFMTLFMPFIILDFGTSNRSWERGEKRSGSSSGTGLFVLLITAETMPKGRRHSP